MKPALLVIDMLNDYLDQWPPARREQLIRATNQLTALMRTHRHPVIWVRQEFEPDMRDAFLEVKDKKLHITARGTRGAQIAEGLEMAAEDLQVIKKRYSAFFQTNLDELLARLRPDALVMAGINTHACIRMAAIDAYQRDWRVVLAEDCIDSYDPEHHRISLKYMKDKIAAVLTTQEIRAALHESSP